MGERVQRLTLQSRTVAVIRTSARPGELSDVVPRLCGEVFAFARERRLAPGRMFALYREGSPALEVGVEVAAPFTESERVACSALPAGEVATAPHLGDYARLGETHGAVRRFCAERGLALAGPFWELYGHGGEDPPRTDVFYLLQPLAAEIE